MFIKVNLLQGQQGSTLIGTMLLVTLMGFMGVAIIEQTASQTTTNSNTTQSVQALQVGTAGIEATKYKLDHGEDPEVTNQPFGPGTYTVQADPYSGLITVTSVVGEAKKTQYLNANFGRHCVSLDASEAEVSDYSLFNVRLIKTCNTEAIVDKMWIDWNWGDCVTDITNEEDDYVYEECENNDDDSSSNDHDNGNHNGNKKCSHDNDSSSSDDNSTDYCGHDDDQKVTICHYPPGNPSKAHTISVGSSAVQAHINNHGDTLGACESDDPFSGCTADEDSTECPLSCDADDDGALIRIISIEGTNIFNSRLGIGIASNGLGAESADEIDVEDYTLTENGTYTFSGTEAAPAGAIQFSKEPPEGGLYRITVEFADGSQISDIFVDGSSSYEPEDSGCNGDDCDNSSEDNNEDDSSCNDHNSDGHCDNGHGNSDHDSNDNDNNDDNSNSWWWWWW